MAIFSEEMTLSRGSGDWVFAFMAQNQRSLEKRWREVVVREEQSLGLGGGLCTCLEHIACTTPQTDDKFVGPTHEIEVEPTQ